MLALESAALKFLIQAKEGVTETEQIKTILGNKLFDNLNL
jgi:hypothetical protein